jgi:magnesium transporter
MLAEAVRPEIEELIEAKNWKELKDFLPSLKSPDIADLIDAVKSEEDRVIIFRLLPKELAADVFSEMEWEMQEMLISKMNNQQIRQILAELHPDDRTHFFEECPGKVTRKLLNLLSPDDRKETLELLGYPEDSIGRIMTPDYVAVKMNWSIQRALNHIRKIGQDSETINMIYVTDSDWKLLDALELRHFILAAPDKKVEDIMDHQYIALSAMDDREKAVEALDHYDLPALPVVDSGGVLVGIVTFDDVIDVAQEETTEDFHKASAISPLEESYGSARVISLYGKRIMWLIALVFMNIFSGAAIASFEAVIEKTVALVFFLPLLIDSGGNAGSQAATLVIRAMAMNEVVPRNWLKLVMRDLCVSILLGLTMGAAVSLLGIYRGGMIVGISVAISMLAVVIMGSTVGTILPFILKLFKLDPATASAPLITSIADILGVVIYFSIASAFLGI